MAIFQPTNVIPSINTNTGVIDVNQPMEISWEVNGNQNMIAFQIDFYQNNAASTFIASTGIIGLTSTLSQNTTEQNANNLPFAGVDGVGNRQFYTYAPKNTDGKSKTWKQFNSAFTDIVDGVHRHSSYKYKITQWYAQTSWMCRGQSNISNFTANTWYYMATREIDGTPNTNFWGFYIDSSTANRINEQVYAYITRDGLNGFLIGVETNTIYFVQTQYINQYSPPSGWIDSGATSTYTFLYYTYVYPTSFDVMYGSYITIPQIFRLSVTGGYGDIKNTLKSNKARFIGVLGQGVIDPINSVRWELAYHNQDGTIGETVIDTGFIPTHTMVFEYNNFLNNTAYAIRLTITQNIAVGATQTIITEWGIFNVKIDEGNFIGTFIAQCLPKENATFLEWNTPQAFNNFRIYRQEVGKNSQMLIATLPAKITILKDYGITSRKAYKYTLFGDVNNSENTYSLNADNTIATCFKNYSLLVCDYDQDNDEYHVRKQYLFALNLSAGSVGNNNSPILNANFTPYPTRMPSTQNYASGTLQGLIGAIYTVPALIEQIGNYKWTSKPSTLDYFDSVDLERELYDLSVAPYQLFLRDMKGRLRMIATSAPITMTTNIKQKQQSITMSLPWVEIGDASDVTIIQTPDDYGWNNDNQVLDVQLDVDLATGELSATYPFPYSGTKFYLTGVNKENLTAKTPNGVTPAQFNLSDTATETNDGEVTATVTVNTENT